jgi:cysteine-rich repeat protein
MTDSVAICGDGLIVGSEQCDDGVRPPSSGDGCSASCKNETGWSCSYDGNNSVCTSMIRDYIRDSRNFGLASLQSRV